MAKNPIERTLDNIGNVVQDIFNGTTEPSTTSSRVTTGQTCLEKMGMTLRAQHLRQNMWRKNDIEYSKPLVLAEYTVQTEFKVSTADEMLEERKERLEEKKAKAAAKKEEKRKKREEKLKKKQESVAGVPKEQQPGDNKTLTEPVEKTK